MSLSEATPTVKQAFALGLRPDPILTVSEWSDKYRRLPQEASAEPGPWRTSRTPFLREIMDELSPASPVREVIFMKGAQVGGSECGNNFTGFIIDYAPGPLLVVQASLDLAKSYSKQRIKTLIEGTPRLREKIKDAKSRDSENSILVKSFRGGMMKIAGANSAASLRSMPARYAFLDEIDGYPQDVEGEGDPVSLAEARTRTFSRKKIFKVSTPTIEGRSRIAKRYGESDRRRYHVPCPHCGEFQWLKWSQVKFERTAVGDQFEPVNTRYICEHCQGEIREHHKTEMLERGKWIAENPGAGGGRIAGFHLSSLYSPVGWHSWEDMARDFLIAEKKPELLKGFINTQLGETWKDRGDAPDWQRLYERREPYPIGSVADPVVFITAGVDVQKDRLECEIVGWGADKQSWSIEYIVIPGDTAFQETWLELDKVLSKSYKKKSGAELPIRTMAVDSGFNTQHVYNWVRRYPSNRVMAVKGKSQAAVAIGQPSAVDVRSNGKRVRRGTKVWTVGTGLIKGDLYATLRQNPPTDEEREAGKGYPPGYCHFPEYGEEFFKQMTAEQLVVRVVRSQSKYEWEKTRDRNEALDCRVYARAAAARVGLDRFNEEEWLALAGSAGVPVAPVAAAPTASGPKPPAAPTPSKPRRRSSFF